MIDERKTLGELLSDPLLARIAPDALRNMDLAKDEKWGKSLAQPLALAKQIPETVLATNASGYITKAYPDLPEGYPGTSKDYYFTTLGSVVVTDGRVLRALEVCMSSGKPFSSFKTGKQAKRDFEIEKIGLSRPREELYDRINRRVHAMVEEGLEEEVRSLLPYRSLTPLQTVGYKEMFDHIDGKTSLDEAVSLIRQHSRNYAKRQLTWWRRDKDIRWIEV